MSLLRASLYVFIIIVTLYVTILTLLAVFL